MDCAVQEMVVQHAAHLRDETVSDTVLLSSSSAAVVDVAVVTWLLTLAGWQPMHHAQPA
jgi:hypothetical protein